MKRLAYVVVLLSLVAMCAPIPSQAKGRKRCCSTCQGGGVVLAAAPGASPTAAQVSQSKVKLEQKGTEIEITIDGKPFTTLRAGKDLRKTYFYPVYAADGTTLTRPIQKPPFPPGVKYDHPHHKGIWFSVDEVSKVDAKVKSKHWVELDPIVNEKVEILVAEGNPAKLKITNTWKTRGGEPLVAESSVVSIFGNRVMIYDATLTALKDPIEFGDTKEGMFAFRFIDGLREQDGAKVVNSNGKKTTKECWGQEADWVDYAGALKGKTYGVALFDHPLNFRKSRYHVRDYGLFSVSPFGPSAYTNKALPKDEVHLPPGSSLHLRYGIYIHDGTTEEAKVPEVYQQFLRNS